jgi:hypothetical protein
LSPHKNGAVLVEVKVCDADLVKIRVCSDLATLQKVLEAPISSERSHKNNMFNIMFQNIIFLLKFDFTAMY